MYVQCAHTFSDQTKRNVHCAVPAAKVILPLSQFLLANVWSWLWYLLRLQDQLVLACFDAPTIPRWCVATWKHLASTLPLSKGNQPEFEQRCKLRTHARFPWFLLCDYRQYGLWFGHESCTRPSFSWNPCSPLIRGHCSTFNKWMCLYILCVCVDDGLSLFSHKSSSYYLKLVLGKLVSSSGGVVFYFDNQLR